ncbi:chemotaxis protein CheW [Halonotius pteroides]|uniref:Chemotaxis protein CheW n=1 Tax=Halonotius pteroides TaxID=268735 RepID=A0A3A6QCK5_9EURY|nr:chemotaxis protein CheW [Halonotius pteroides]
MEYVTEITDRGEMTSVPNTPAHVEGVMDLRGLTTTIVNPLVVLEGESLDPAELVTDGGKATNRIIMLDRKLVDGDGAIGWLVSTVSNVTDIPTDAIEADTITDSPLFGGVVKRDEEGFLIWLNPNELTA